MIVALVFAFLVAAGPREPDDPRLAEALIEYRALELERTVSVLDDLLFDGSISSQQRARALLLRGLCAAQLGDPVAARASFLEAYTEDDTVSLDLPIPTKVQGLMAGAAAEVASRSAPPTTMTPPGPTATAAPPGPPVSTRSASLPLAIAGGTMVGLGSISLVGGAIAGVVGLQRVAQGDDADATQAEAVVLADEANTAFVVGLIGGTVGLLATGIGAGLLAISAAE